MLPKEANSVADNREAGIIDMGTVPFQKKAVPAGSGGGRDEKHDRPARRGVTITDAMEESLRR